MIYYIFMIITFKKWTDQLISWDPSNYGGIDFIHVPLDKIWIPDIFLYNV